MKMLTAMITPFNNDLEVDYKEISKLVNYLIDHKTDGIVVLGTTGENPTLTEVEKIKIVKQVIKTNKKRVPIIVNVGTNNTKETILFAKKIIKLDIDGLMVVTPYYNKPTQEGLYAHYKEINDNVDKPIMIYNVPSRTGVNITSDTIIKLSKLENIKMLKYAYDSKEEVKKIVDNTNIEVYSGDDGNVLNFMEVGGLGVVSVLSHVIGKEFYNIIESNDKDSLNQYDALIKLLFKESNPMPVKYMMSKLGFNSMNLRLPLVEISDNLKQEIDNYFKANNIK